jgi:hypothetical protein
MTPTTPTPTPRTGAVYFASNNAGIYELFQANEVYLKENDQLRKDIAELNERLIDRQKTLMAALTENQNLKRELDKANQ